MSAIIAFQGMTPNIGTTVVSFMTAWLIARQTSASVGYICLNLKSSKLHHYCGIDQPKASLDSIRVDLRSQTLTTGQLFSHCARYKPVLNLHILYGNGQREQAEFYAAADISHLLQVCRAAFDITVTEVNAYWDNAATFSTMLEADYRILTCTNRLHSFQEDYRRWVRQLAPRLNLKLARFKLYVTRYDRTGVAGYGLRDIRRQTGIDIIGCTKESAQIGDWLDQGRLLELANAETNALHADLQPLLRMLEHDGRFKRKPDFRRSQSGLWRKWLAIKPKG